jgi:oligoribonuclease NrnB/cAMP/cGMP phosphodiesterase (DHH superfamily)
VYDNGDNDGLFSAAVIRAAYEDAILKGWRYEEPMSLAKLEKQHGKFSMIIIVDLPLLKPFKEWENLTAKDCLFDDGTVVSIQGREILWFDHHASNEKDCKERGLWPVEGNQSQKNCSAFNAYEYLSGIDLVPDDAQCIKYIDTYDCWKKTGGLVKWEQALNFNFGMKSMKFNGDPEEICNEFLLNDDENDVIDEVLSRGDAIRSYIKNNANYLKHAVEICEFEGYEMKFANITTEKSYMAELLNDNGIIALWSYTGDKYLYSLRTKRTDVDLSEIAKKYGGGGHKQAAGFSCDTMIHKHWSLMKAELQK